MKMWEEEAGKNREGEGKWSMKLHLSQLVTAGVLGEKGESVHPHYQCLLTCLLIISWVEKLIAQLASFCKHEETA